MRRLFSTVLTALAASGFATADGGDWTQWRYDAGRTADAPHVLPDKLYLQWSRQLPRPERAWKDKSNAALYFDVSYEPVIMGKRIFVPSMVRDRVTAYDTDTGEEEWRFYADGPIRFAPSAHRGRLYVVSDDGYLYCLNAKSGGLVWKYRGAPSREKIMGNRRLSSMWPARGGPVIYKGTLYFAAGIWPFMGTFVHAVDLNTGRAVWVNSRHGSDWMAQPHSGAVAFAGLAPQGYLAATERMLLVPGGRTNPAGLDRKTGRLAYFAGGRLGYHGYGSYRVITQGDFFFANTGSFRLKDGKAVARAVGGGVFTSNAIYRGSKGDIAALRFPPELVTRKDRKGKPAKVLQFTPFIQADMERQIGRCGVSIKAGHRLYGASAAGTVVAFDLQDGKRIAVSWKGKVEGAPWSLLAGDGKLFVVTHEGGLFCFGGRNGEARRYELKPLPADAVTDSWSGTAKEILDLCGTKSGYCVSLGLGSGRLVEEILRQSRLAVIVVEPDVDKVATFRRRMDAMGLYGSRITAHAGRPLQYGLPPYLANLVVSEDLAAAGIDPVSAPVELVFGTLRPYGGLASLRMKEGHGELVARLKSAGLPGARISAKGDVVVLRRPGALQGSASWTHQYADASNSVCSRDKRVKPPFGLLWFGGPPNDPILPRHGHGPSPQIVGGRLFIEGADLMRAVDVYTGRLLWEKPMKNVAKYYNRTVHHPGAGGIGSNYVSLDDGIYVKTPQSCLRLDPATGKTMKEFKLPKAESDGEAHWGFITVSDDLLIAASSPLAVPYEHKADVEEAIEEARKKGGTVKPPPRIPNARLGQIPRVRFNAEYSTASKTLHVMDRHSGRLLWSRKADQSFRHNAIIAGRGTVFCIDKLSPAKLFYVGRRGYVSGTGGVLYALNGKTGQVQWQTSENVFGTWLGYSAEHDVLLQAGSAYHDRARDDIGRGMVAYRGTDGTVLWKDLDARYGGPCILHHDRIITQGGGRSLLTGRQTMRIHALTGERIPWSFTRSYGCNSAIAGEHVITFRSAAAGYFDLARDGGTGNLGGFKSGCTSNLIPADGVLNAPDYTRTCTCAYHNQASLAMIHMPDAEVWTFNKYKWTGRRVRRVGLNFGAPGDRKAGNGTLWLDVPSVGGDSPNIPVRIKGGTTGYFRHHSMLVENRENKPWVAASGVSGAEEIRISLATKPKKSSSDSGAQYTVRLHFADFDSKGAGERVFNVALQGKEVLTNFDVVKQAGGAKRSVVREFPGVTVGHDMTVGFKAVRGEPLLCGMEILLKEENAAERKGLR